MGVEEYSSLPVGAKHWRSNREKQICHLPSQCIDMVSETTRDDMTWYECDVCGLLFDNKEDARQHEGNCDDEDPSYIQ